MGDEVSRGRVFISYRRSDAPATAGRLYDRLEGRFGSSSVFMDVDSIWPGYDFTEAIESAVGACDVLLAVIGRDWITATDEQGRRKLDDPDDFITLEITAAFARGIPVIPILVDGASPPRRDDLPRQLISLARRQAIRLDHDNFAADLSKLMAALEHILTRISPHAEPKRAPASGNVVIRPRVQHSGTTDADGTAQEQRRQGQERRPNDDHRTADAVRWSQYVTGRKTWGLSGSAQPEVVEPEVVQPEQDGGKQGLLRRYSILTLPTIVVAVALLFVAIGLGLIPRFATPASTGGPTGTSDQNLPALPSSTGGPTETSDQNLSGLLSHLPPELQSCGVVSGGQLGASQSTSTCADGMTYFLFESPTAASANVTSGSTSGSCSLKPSSGASVYDDWSESGATGIIECREYGSYFALRASNEKSPVIVYYIGSGDYTGLLSQTITAAAKLKPS